MVADLPRTPPPPLDSRCALFLDVDGTLLDFAPWPDAVTVPDALPEVLRLLHRELDGALALISGRPLRSLDTLFHPLRLPAAGMHGLELRNGVSLRSPPPAPAALADVLEDAHAFAAAHPGTVVEDKGTSIGLHWRNAPGHADAVHGFAEGTLRRLPGYCLQAGNHVVELRPKGADKGDAIDLLMEQEPFRERRPVFVGDDLTDEHGFAVVNARGGASVLVGRRSPSAALHGLADTAAVLEWLQEGTSA
ncbi:trehalose-phosphatase [Luteimonas qiangzhengi]|uniref:trehalose-phosphatase n=1 Tax=Luteimonas sp. MJ146 TaxID=3129240 RepID=UPI0031BB3C8D